VPRSGAANRRREKVSYERLDAASGANFGWPAFEGAIPFDPLRPGVDPPLAPVIDYPHAGGGCAVVGGHVVRDRTLESLRGRYLYSDYCHGELRSFVPERGGAGDDRALGPALPGIRTFGEGRRDQVLVATHDGVYRLVPKPAASSRRGGRGTPRAPRRPVTRGAALERPGETRAR
jgi:hypothetical protein